MDFYVGQGPVQGEAEASGSKFLDEPSGKADYKVQGESHRERLIRAFRTIILDERIGFDQLIIYPTFIHVSYVSNGKNRSKLIRGFGNGKYYGLSRTEALALG